MMTLTYDVPPGFRTVNLPSNDGFIGINGPIQARHDEDGLVFGIRIEPRHCNPMGICHGGWLATLMDMVMPINARIVGGLPDNFLLTVHMALDYLGSAPVGSWVEGRGRVLRKTKRLVFADALLTIEGEAIMRGSGIFRIGPAGPPLTI